MTRDDWIFEPDHFIQYLRSLDPKMRTEMRLPSRVVLVFGQRAFQACTKEFRARVTKWNSHVALGRTGPRRIAVVRSPIGAAAATIDLEESIALGARTVLTLGSCGSLVADLPIGSLVLPTAAYSDEGTSAHYGGARWAHPDASLTRRIRIACGRRSLTVREGAVWTMDAIYRESRSRARALVRRGLIGVEMEASALFTIGRYRGIRIAGLFVVSDELAGDKWRPGFSDPAYVSGIRKATKVVADIFSGAHP